MSLSTEQPIQQQHLEIQGLSEDQVQERRARGESNTVRRQTSRSYSRILRQNAFTAVNILLFAISVFLVVLSRYGDAVVTAGLVLANVVVGVFQEARAKRQLDRIALVTRPVARVIRDGTTREIDPSEIVKDDVLTIHSGDQILVDGTVLTEGSLAVDESLLTGESDLVYKHLGDKIHSGSFCMVGGGIYQADSVGEDSLAQEITEEARAFRVVKTPLQREIDLVIRVMALLVVLISVPVADAFRNIYNMFPMVETVQAAAVMVALVPQGLIFMVTVTYALAVIRLSGKGTLIQRMNAVESTSHIDVLCLDKTGTLTTNNLKLHELFPVSLTEAELRRLLGEYVASLTDSNRTSRAIAEGCPGIPQMVRDEVPFSSSYKWSGLAFDKDGIGGLYVLGAPEVLGPNLRADPRIDGKVEEWTSAGFRVLVFACLPDVVVLSDGDGNPDLPDDLIPLGVVCLSDELRPHVRETVAGFAEAGVGLKVISGDHPQTIGALARQAGIESEGPVIVGADIDGMEDAELGETAIQSSIFARVTPQQKQRLIESLARTGHYVAMTGDGVNDVLALKQAQLAIAMRSGSEVTRGIADIVLIDDSFESLPQVFQEGQRILRGMHDVIKLFLVRTLYVALVIVGVALLHEMFPVTPKHNSILALLTVGIPAFALATWARPGAAPRRLLPLVVEFVVPAAVTIAGVGLTVYLFFLSVSDDVEMAQSALTTTTVFCGLLLVPFAQPPTDAWTGGSELHGDWRPALLAVAMLMLYGVVLFVPVVRDFYELDTLPFPAYLMIGLVVTGWAVILRLFWRLQIWQRINAYREKIRAQAT